jgi:hypothetical protein
MRVEKEWPLKCTICGNVLPTDGPRGDLAHVPNDVSKEAYEMLRALWGVDPHADLIVCESCMSADKVWGDASDVELLVEC